MKFMGRVVQTSDYLFSDPIFSFRDSFRIDDDSHRGLLSDKLKVACGSIRSGGESYATKERSEQ